MYVAQGFLKKKKKKKKREFFKKKKKKKKKKLYPYHPCVQWFKAVYVVFIMEDKRWRLSFSTLPW